MRSVFNVNNNDHARRGILSQSMTQLPPCKVGDCYLCFGPIFGDYLAPYLDSNIGAGCGFTDPQSEAGVINLNTGNKFLVKTGPHLSEYYNKLVEQLKRESAHIDGKEIERMIPYKVIIKDGQLFAVVKF